MAQALLSMYRSEVAALAHKTWWGRAQLLTHKVEIATGLDDLLAAPTPAGAVCPSWRHLHSAQPALPRP